MTGDCPWLWSNRRSNRLDGGRQRSQQLQHIGDVGLDAGLIDRCRARVSLERYHGRIDSGQSGRYRDRTCSAKTRDIGGEIRDVSLQAREDRLN